MCEDDQQVEAHKVKLSSASQFFQRVLSKNPHPHPLIYLRELKMEDVKAIVDFIYLGHTEVSSEDLGTFLQVAEDLEVRGLQSQLENKEHINGLKNFFTMEKIEEDKTIFGTHLKSLNYKCANVIKQSMCLQHCEIQEMLII